MKPKLINKLKVETGSGLVLSLMVLLVLSVLGSALGVLTIGSYKLADTNHDSNSAYYIAEAGANMAYEEIQNRVIGIYNDSSESTYYDNVNDFAKEVAKETNKKIIEEDIFQNQFGDKPIATITIEDSEDAGGVRKYFIKSIGEVAGKTRTVEKPIQVNWKSKGSEGINPPSSGDSAITYNGNANINGPLFVIGNIYKTERAPNLNVGNLKHSDNKIEILNKDWEDFKTEFTKQLNQVVTQIREQNKIGTYPGGKTFNQNEVITENLVNNNGNIMFEKDVKVENADIIMNGGGITFKRNVNINNGNIITAGSDVLFEGTQTIINGSVIKTTPGEIQFKAPTLITGNVINLGGSIHFNNTQSIVNGAVIALNGDIQVNGAVNIIGTLMANSFSINNKSTITYSDKYKKLFPFGSSDNTGSDVDDLITTSPAIEP